MKAVDSIIAIHGRGSNASTSSTVALLRGYFVPRDYEFHAPSYNTDASYTTVKAYFDRFINSLDKSKTYAVIGCSLGGYWARYVANRLTGARLVMINPSLRFYGSDDQRDKGDTPIFVWLAMDDDVVDPKYALELYRSSGRARVYAHKTGGHRFSHLSSSLDNIEKDINTVMG